MTRNSDPPLPSSLAIHTVQGGDSSHRPVISHTREHIVSCLYFASANSMHLVESPASRKEYLPNKEEEASIRALIPRGQLSFRCFKTASLPLYQVPKSYHHSIVFKKC